MDERLLITRVLAGDDVAARELYDAHVDRVFRLCYRLTGDEEIARDCTQDTFIRMFERLDTFRGEAALSTWLHTVAITVTFNALRKVNRHRQRETELEEAFVLSAVSDGAEPDLKQRLKHAIDALPDAYRVVLLMHDLEGYTHEEIGNALGVRTGTSKARLSRARAALRETLAPFAGEWA